MGVWAWRGESCVVPLTQGSKEAHCRARQSTWAMGQSRGARSAQGPSVGRGEEGKGTQAEDEGSFRGGTRYATDRLAPHMARSRFSMLLAGEWLSQRYCTESVSRAVK